MYTEENLRLTSKIADEAELEHDLEVWLDEDYRKWSGRQWANSAELSKTCK